MSRESLPYYSFPSLNESKGIFFLTHITSDLNKIADYVTFINDGEIILSENKDFLLDNYGLVKGKKSC